MNIAYHKYLLPFLLSLFLAFYIFVILLFVVQFLLYILHKPRVRQEATSDAAPPHRTISYRGISYFKVYQLT